MSDFFNNKVAVRFEERIGFGIELPAPVYSMPIDECMDLADALRVVNTRFGNLVSALNSLGCTSHAGRQKRLRAIYDAGGWVCRSGETWFLLVLSGDDVEHIINLGDQP